MMITKENALLVMVDFQMRLMPAIYEGKSLEKRAKGFIAGCRLLNVPVLVTQQYTKGLGGTISSLQDAAGDAGYIEKITFNCCDNEEFIDTINRSGKKDIIVTGTEAHICVQQTVLGLREKGFNVYVVADCIGSRFETDRLYAEERMRQAGAVITTGESLLYELLKSADNPKRKEINELLK